jgi:replicative DNA helicase
MMENNTTETQRKVISQIIHSDIPDPWRVLQDYQHKGIDSDCFTDPICTRIYSVLLDLQSRDVQFDEICLMTEFETSPELDVEDLMSLTDYGTSSHNPYHVEALLEQKRLRGIVRASRLAIEGAGMGTESHQIITELQSAITKTSELVSEEKSIDSCVDDFVTSLFAEPETGYYRS